MTRSIRQLLVVAGLVAVALALQASPAAAAEETVGSCMFEELVLLVEEAEAEYGSLEALEEKENKDALVEFEETLEDCFDAPNPILPAIDEIIWGSLAFALLLGFMVWKGFPAVKGAMDARSEKIRADLDDADRAKAEAMRVQADYEAQLADAKTEAARLIDDARTQADQLKQELSARAEADIADMRERAAADIEAGRQQAITDLRSEVSEIALGAAERVVGASLDRETQSQLIDAYIEEVATSNGH